MCGSIRAYDNGTLQEVIKQAKLIAKNSAEQFGCTADVEIIYLYPATINHGKETGHIERLAKKWLGEENFCKDDLPLTPSEDFSFFLENRPGCFFMLGTMKPSEKDSPKTLHTATYDFNDNMIATGTYFYTRIVEDRLGVSLLA